MSALLESSFTLYFFLALALFGLYLTHIANFLLFHTLAELFSVVVAFTVFVMAWKSQRFLNNGYLLFVGIALSFVGGIDLLHTLAYSGMGVFSGGGSNLATQLWIAARYMQAFSMLLAPFFLYRRLPAHLLIFGYGIVSTLLLLSIFHWGIFPDSYIDNIGLTPFKKVSEYIIALILAVAMFILLANRKAFHPSVLNWLVLSFFASILSEAAFTEYVNVYGFANMLGHLLKILAFFFIFKAIVETGFDRPYDILFHQLKQSEDALRRSEARLRRLVDSNMIGVIFTNIEGSVQEANDAFLTMIGYTRAELNAGKIDWRTLTPEEYLSLDEFAITDALQSPNGACRPYEKEYIRKDGSHVPIMIGFAFLEGSFTHTVGFILDLTDRKKAQEALYRIEWLLTKSVQRESIEKVESSNALSPDGIPDKLNRSGLLFDAVGQDVLNDVIMDSLDLLETAVSVYETSGDYAQWIYASGWCSYLNQASQRLCSRQNNAEAPDGGQRPCQQSCWHTAALDAIRDKKVVDIPCMGGMNIYSVPILVGEKVAGALCAAYGDPPKDRVIIEDIAARYEVPVEELARLAAAYESRPPFMVELAKNRLQVSARLLGSIVEREQAERAMLQYAEALERTNQELKDFAFIASHDLQEPLRKIQAFGQRLSDKYEHALDDDAQMYLERINSASARMQRMIRDLLEYSRITTTARPFERVDLAKVAAEVVSDLEMSIERNQGTVEIGRLPEIDAEPVHMRQLFQNLIGNALKFHRPGVPPQVQVSFALLPGSPVSREVFMQLQVRDNGIGFDEQHLERIFHPFQRLVGRSEFEGSGIGLAICRKIVDRHHGDITAKSVPGAGTTFTVTLPVRQNGHIGPGSNTDNLNP